MSGFRNVQEYVAACEGGQNWITQFRKVFPSSTVANWFDISSGAGSYAPNYFASAPLTSALMAENKGIFHARGHGRQYIKDFTVMATAASATSTASDNVRFVLYDFLMYYPFIDLTSTGLQEFENTVELPRCVDGNGVQLLMILQANNGSYSNPSLTINYTNQSGVAKTVTNPLHWATYLTAQIITPLPVSSGNAYNGPHTALAVGDSGLRSIQSVQLSADYGGLAAFVLAKPILVGYVGQGCRRTTTGNLDSFGAPTQHQSLIHAASVPYFDDGAYLTPICSFTASGAGTGSLVGTLETVWNN